MILNLDIAQNAKKPLDLKLIGGHNYSFAYCILLLSVTSSIIKFCQNKMKLTSNSVSDSGSPNRPPFEPSSVSSSIFSEFSDCLRLELGMAGFSRRT